MEFFGIGVLDVYDFFVVGVVNWVRVVSVCDVRVVYLVFSFKVRNV